MLSAAEIISALDGTNAAARVFRVSPPSVSEWLRKGAIPEDKLIRRAARLEKLVPGFHRKTQWPDEFGEIWPEIAHEGRDRHEPAVAEVG